jgi:hypothetical protein
MFTFPPQPAKNLFYEFSLSKGHFGRIGRRWQLSLFVFGRSNLGIHAADLVHIYSAHDPTFHSSGPAKSTLQEIGPIEGVLSGRSAPLSLWKPIMLPVAEYSGQVLR